MSLWHHYNFYVTNFVCYLGREKYFLLKRILIGDAFKNIIYIYMKSIIYIPVKGRFFFLIVIPTVTTFYHNLRYSQGQLILRHSKTQHLILNF